MKSGLKFKTRVSIPYILAILLSFLCITQINDFMNGDFFNKTTWLIYGMILMDVFIFNLFFVRSFELQTTFLKVRYSLFFRSPKIYNISDITYVKAIFLRGKGVIPSLKIRYNNKEITHYYFLISKKSINKLIATLKEMNVDAIIINSLTELNKR